MGVSGPSLLIESMIEILSKSIHCAHSHSYNRRVHKTIQKLLVYILYSTLSSSSIFIICLKTSSCYLPWLKIKVWWFGSLPSQILNYQCAMYITLRWSHTEPSNLNPPICLQCPFGTQPPHLMTANISGYTAAKYGKGLVIKVSPTYIYTNSQAG